MPELKYLGERQIAGEPLVVRSLGDDKRVLDLRRDLAPGLPLAFDWGPASARPRAQRLSLAILADAVQDRANGDELALRHFRAFRELTIDRFADGFFELGAWAVNRWLAEQEDTRQRATSRKAVATARRAV